MSTKTAKVEWVKNPDETEAFINFFKKSAQDDYEIECRYKSTHPRCSIPLDLHENIQEGSGESAPKVTVRNVTPQQQIVEIASSEIKHKQEQDKLKTQSSDPISQSAKRKHTNKTQKTAPKFEKSKKNKKSEKSDNQKPVKPKTRKSAKITGKVKKSVVKKKLLKLTPLEEYILKT